MRQRAALIRTLVTDPDIILLDEPFSALDYQTRLVLEEEILSILNEFGKTVVLITHDIGEAISMSDRIVVMSQRPTWNKKPMKSAWPNNTVPPWAPAKMRAINSFSMRYGLIWIFSWEVGHEHTRYRGG